MPHWLSTSIQYQVRIQNFWKESSLGGSGGISPGEFWKIEGHLVRFLAFLQSTYKCRVGSARLEHRASSALRTGKIKRTLNKNRRHSKIGSRPPGPLSGSAPVSPCVRQPCTEDGISRTGWYRRIPVRSGIYGLYCTLEQHLRWFPTQYKLPRYIMYDISWYKCKCRIAETISPTIQRGAWVSINKCVFSRCLDRSTLFDALMACRSLFQYCGAIICHY